MENCIVTSNLMIELCSFLLIVIGMEVQDWHCWSSVQEWIMTHMVLLQTGTVLIMTHACGQGFIVSMVKWKSCKSLLQFVAIFQIPYIYMFWGF